VQAKLSRVRDTFSSSLRGMHMYDRLLSEYLRKSRGDQTVRAFARKIGLTHGTLHRIENLQQSLTIGKLGQVMEKLDCSWEEIFGKAKLPTAKRVASPILKPLLPKKLGNAKTSKAP
jgi:transcriptional regulator with XRE-family HTH domain